MINSRKVSIKGWQAMKKLTKSLTDRQRSSVSFHVEFLIGRNIYLMYRYAFLPIFMKFFKTIKEHY
ncbi:hypothetical protein CJ214_01265 [Peptoniphilus lacrimalis]|uniref:Uncharacterized protein n=1 Tax=Gardnerella vaginalis TaxID=2702 RepID=A0A3E1IZ48_GARVA|nr:hypothetical protein CJ214_00010 [Peptoniphilus lacrimalis]PMC45632.1 hypothetical protein CJ214_01265 [Peptoniphilus lacrimalis]RFD78295.1 hypothetical protein AXE77_05390 [Gardnerella vaginalis]